MANRYYDSADRWHDQGDRDRFDRHRDERQAEGRLEPRSSDYPHGRGYGHDYMRGGEALGGYGYAEREGYTMRRGETDVTRESHAGKGPRNFRRGDERIMEDVCEMLTRDADVDASDIEVSVKDGEVTLSGTVPDRRMKRRAEDVAERAAGVRDVHNRLTLASAESGAGIERELDRDIERYADAASGGAVRSGAQPSRSARPSRRGAGESRGGR